MNRQRQPVRGVKDLLTTDTRCYCAMERILHSCLMQYGYEEWRLPFIELKSLFCHAVGATTDVISKEMYLVSHEKGSTEKQEPEMILRPEGTAGCVRALLHSGLLPLSRVQRTWYQGAMFRHERPQKGRYRQFYQLGVECFGGNELETDLELLLLSYRMWRALGIDDQLCLELNYLGSATTRDRYRHQLQAYFSPYWDQLPTHAQATLTQNPLRIWDTKDPAMLPYLAQAPTLSRSLTSQEQTSLERLQSALESLGLPYQTNPRLVRGLDYYNGMVFEWTSPSLGSQRALCGGGRYDGLIEHLGGPPTKAVGLAIGLDRLALIWRQQACNQMEEDPVIYFLSEDTFPIRLKALQVAERLRNMLSVAVVVHTGSGSLLSQVKRAKQYATKVLLFRRRVAGMASETPCRSSV